MRQNSMQIIYIYYHHCVFLALDLDSEKHQPWKSNISTEIICDIIKWWISKEAHSTKKTASQYAQTLAGVHVRKESTMQYHSRAVMHCILMSCLLFLCWPRGFGVKVMLWGIFFQDAGTRAFTLLREVLNAIYSAPKLERWVKGIPVFLEQSVWRLINGAESSTGLSIPSFTMVRGIKF